jgi:hypothetical protein
MPAYQSLPAELMQTLLSPERYAAWQRQQEASREFWRTLNGPAERPLGSNADEWNLFISENKDASGYLCVQIAEAIDEAERRGQARGYFHYEEQQCPGHVAARFNSKVCGLCGTHVDSLRPDDEFSH